jgi:hypothetical protein
MANLVSCLIYGANKNDWNNGSTGTLMSFSTENVVFRQLPANTFYSGVLCATAIQLMPTAPGLLQPEYYTPVAITTATTGLLALANA